MSEVIVVKAVRDAEAGVWLVESSDVPGLRLEGETLEELAEKLPGAILDLLEAGGGVDDGLDVPVELIAHASTRVRSPAA
ncbi:hypothetical protein KBTX_02467 [wastewater metagenome]|uniref:DUF1902 domain-containing protein n=2 Tax=unclassified sequences TaxID=12908 RepID=A0A5B8RHG2_9ZZZZ|nr:DUF1902 domain-containing protein [Arhodomonas sp. KWT]QEA06137.1 hypothetical protein KBTEX_02467 [uncultured organism]